MVAKAGGMRFYLLLGAVFALMASTALCDIVVTADGRRVEGEVEEDGDDIVVKTRFGKVRIPSAQVVKIIPKASPREEYASKLSDLKLSPDKWEKASAHYELGSWARSQRLYKEARDCFERALGKDPDHRKAHMALGHALKDGVWVRRSAPGGTGSKRTPPVKKVVPKSGLTEGTESKHVTCTKCGGDAVLLERDCQQCNGKGYSVFGAGKGVCRVCGGTGKWQIGCVFCGLSGRHIRGRYTHPTYPTVRIPHSGWMHCPKCSGTMYMDASVCRQCLGKGYNDFQETATICQTCNGFGKIPNLCVFCGGKGLMKKR